MTVIQEIIKELEKKPDEMVSQKSIAEWLQACYLQKEKEHLIGMCSIGSRNAGIDPESVYSTKYER